MAASVSLSRRAFLIGALACPALAQAQGVDRTAQVQRGLDEATRAGRPFTLDPGVTNVRSLVLPSGCILRGAPAGSTLMISGAALTAPRHATRIDIQNVAISRPDGAGALIDFADVSKFVLSGVVLTKARDAIRLERCSGRIEQSTIRDCSRAALFSLDSSGLLVLDNTIENCGDNGIQIWGGVQRHDGSRVVGNRIRGIRNASGGTGEYGNGISIYRAGDVVCERNFIRDCAFTALRNNSGHKVSFVENVCLDSGETAIFAEFAWRDAVIRDNLVDRAACGIQLVNFADHGGRGGICTGNVLRKIGAWREQHEGSGIGIKAEAETLVAGNRIEGADWIGIMAGWGAALRDLTVERNTLSDCALAIAGSVAPGAGAARIQENRIERSRQAALVGMEWKRVVTGDLAKAPDGAYRNIEHARNSVA